MSRSTNYIVPCPNPNSSAHFTVYYKPSCGYSMRALSLLKDYRGKNKKQLLYSAYNAEAIIENIQKEKNIPYLAAKEIFFKKFDRLTGKRHRTFPLIFINKGGNIIYLGGASELEALFNSR